MHNDEEKRANESAPHSEEGARASNDPLLGAICERLKGLIVSSQEAARLDPSRTTLDAVVLTEHLYSVPPPGDPSPQHANAPRVSSGLLHRIEQAQRNAGTAQPFHEFPVLNDTNAIAHWVVDLDTATRCTTATLGLHRSRMREFVETHKLDHQGKDRFYSIGFASFCEAHNPDEIYLEFQVGPTYGAGRIHKVVREEGGVRLSQLATLWTS